MSREELAGDASTLIYLAKAEAFPIAARCVPRILVPAGAWYEAVDEGERIGAPDVPRIRAAADDGSLLRIELSSDQAALAAAIAAQHRLGVGESEVLAVARLHGEAIVDEGRASRVARHLGIIPISTLFLPVVGRAREALAEEEAIAFLRTLAVVTGARADVVFAIEQHLQGAKK